MANNPVIGIDVVARLDQLKAQLSQIPGITAEQSKLMLGELSKNLKAATKATQDAAKSAAEANKRMEQSFAKTKEAAAGAAAGISVISPELGKIVNAAGQFVGVGKSTASAIGEMGLAAGPAALALGAVLAALIPVAGQLVVYERAAEDAAARTEFLAKHMHDLDSAVRGLEDAELAAAVATGKLSDAQADQIKAEEKAARSIDDFAKSHEQERQAATDAYYAAQSRLQQLDALPGFLKTAIDYYGGYTDAQNQSLFVLNNLNREEGQHQAIIAKTEKAEKAAAKATHDKADADKASAAAAKLAAEAERKANEALQAREALSKELAASVATRVKTETDAQAQLEAASRASSESLMSDRDRILAQLDDEIAKYRAIADAAEKANVSADANAKAEATFQELRVSLIAEANKKIDALNETSADKTSSAYAAAAQKLAAAVTSMLQAAAASSQEVYQNAADNVQRLTEYESAANKHLTASQRAELDERIKQQKAAAKKAFETSQAARLGEAVISTASAAIQAYNDGLSVGGPVGLVLGPTMAAAAAAAGAVEIAAISSEQPAFDVGGMIQPDRRAFVGQPGEAIVSKQGVSALGGQEGLSRINAGMGQSAPMFVVSEYRHTRTVDRYERDRLSRNNPYAQAINVSLKPGQRTL